MLQHCEEPQGDDFVELRNVKPGSIILVERKLYDHYAIYAGNGSIIHYAQKNNRGGKYIHKAGLDEFLDGADRFYVPYLPQNDADIEALIKYHVQRRSFLQEIVDDLFNTYNEMVAKVYTASETLSRAIGRIGENLYSIIGNNCEHFAFWCKFKVKISNQIGRLFDFFNDFIKRTLCQRFHNCVIC